MSDNPVKKTRNRRRLITNARLYFALPYFDPFVRWLEARKYTKGTIAGLITQFGHWTQWMHKAGFGIATVRDGYSASVPALKNKPYSHLRLRAGALFILFLEGEGLVDCEPTPPSPPEIWPIIADFRGWMRGHRGALDSSLDTYQVILVDLMLSLATNRRPIQRTQFGIRAEAGHQAWPRFREDDGDRDAVVSAVPHCRREMSRRSRPCHSKRRRVAVRPGAAVSQ